MKITPQSENKILIELESGHTLAVTDAGDGVLSIRSARGKFLNVAILPYVLIAQGESVIMVSVKA